MNITIVELPEFIRRSEKLMSAEEHDQLLSFPELCQLVPKLRTQGVAEPRL
jgi:hypothetical protein